jgi:UDP-N-acetylmuramoylalanine--D-glutamate ligase
MRGDDEVIDLGDMAITGCTTRPMRWPRMRSRPRSSCRPRAMQQALREFTGLPHRVELVARANGISFFDDSKGTNVGASVAALEGFREKVVLIAGGDGKGQDFSPLLPAVKAHARAVVLIGRDAPAMAAVLVEADVPLANATSMEEAVEASYALAHKGDAVLLSPACASFDMFRNYGHRGDVFAEAARALAEREGP